MSDICRITNLKCIRCNPGACWNREHKKEKSEQEIVTEIIDQLEYMITKIEELKGKKYFSCDNVILMLNMLIEFIKEK